MKRLYSWENSNTMKTTQLIIFFLACCLSSSLYGQDLVYKPTNPAFGGDTFNYQWLLSSAQAQDLTEDLREDNLSQRNQLEDFASSLNRSILSQLSRQLVSTQFGTNSELEDGSYQIGSFQIDVSNTLDGIVISIFDSALGERTEVIIPNP